VLRQDALYRNLIRGHAVVSMDIGSKEQTVWSELAKPSPDNSGDGDDDYDDNEDEDEDMYYNGDDRHRQLRNEFKNQKCEEYVMSRWRSSAALLSIALPITILSARLWLTKAVPTSSVTFFIGMMLTFMFIGALFDPWSRGMGGLAIWNIAGSTVFFFLSAFQLSVDTKVSKAPFWWAMYVISLMTLLWAGMGIIGEFMNARMYSYGDEVESYEVITWIGTSIFVFIPIAVSGCLVNSRLLFCMGMLGLALDASVATLRLFDGKESNGWKVTIIVLCTLLFGVVGISVLRRWAFIHGKLVGWMSRCTAHVCSVEMPRDGDADDNAEEAAGLLLEANDEAEAA